MSEHSNGTLVPAWVRQAPSWPHFFPIPVFRFSMHATFNIAYPGGTPTHTIGPIITGADTGNWLRHDWAWQGCRVFVIVKLTAAYRRNSKA